MLTRLAISFLARDVNTFSEKANGWSFQTQALRKTSEIVFVRSRAGVILRSLSFHENT